MQTYIITDTMSLTPTLVLVSDSNGNDVGSSVYITMQHAQLFYDAGLAFIFMFTLVLAFYFKRMLLP
jgi:hypothetical protein